MSQGPTPTPQPTGTPPPQPSGKYCPCARCRCRGLMGPTILITVGALFLIDQMDISFLARRLDFSELWPIILIVIGAVKLFEYGASTEGHRG